jgi:hypothetical protein
MFSLSMFGPFRCSVFRGSVPFEVRSFDIQSFDVRSHSRFGLSMFGPFRCSVFPGSVFRRSVFRGSVLQGSVIRGSVTVSKKAVLAIQNCLSKRARFTVYCKMGDALQLPILMSTITLLSCVHKVQVCNFLKKCYSTTAYPQWRFVQKCCTAIASLHFRTGLCELLQKKSCGIAIAYCQNWTLLRPSAGSRAIGLHIRKWANNFVSKQIWI